MLITCFCRKSLLTTLSMAACFSVIYPQHSIPALDWVKRSDWIDVKTDISTITSGKTANAVGNGIADDAKSIQAALDYVNTPAAKGMPKGVTYLPPGTYRITKTLQMDSSTGAFVVGHGKNTVLTWAGAPDSAMLRHAGATHATYIGLTWEGNNIAGSGICLNGYPNNSLGFSTFVRNQYEAFRNFRYAGIRTANRDDYNNGRLGNATSESDIVNCLFENNANGMTFQFYNYYNEQAVGCEFYGGGNGIQVSDQGQIYANACRFENSTGADLVLGASYGNSVRNCISAQSNMFISGSTFSAQNCRIDNWKTINTQSPILANAGAPFLVFDCMMSNSSPDTLSYVKLQGLGKMVWSNISGNLAHLAVASSSGASSLTQIPTSLRIQKGPALKPNGHFIPQTVNMTGTVFDIRNYGASTSLPNNASAIQNAIVAASTAGNGARVHIPLGTWNVTTKILVVGSNYTIEGSGYGSILNWNGSAGTNEAMVVVSNIGRVKIEHLCLKNTANTIPGLLYKGTASAGERLDLDRVIVLPETYAVKINQVMNKGVVASNLDANDSLIIGSGIFPLYCSNSGDAVIVGQFINGVLTCTGTDRGGFIGFNCLNGSIFVENSHPLVVGDFYTEQSGGWGTTGPLYNVISVRGTPADVPGCVTINCARMHVVDTDSMIRIKGFNGNFGCLRGQFTLGEQPPGSLRFRVDTANGARGSVVLMANTIPMPSQFVVNVGGADTLVVVESMYLPNFIPGPQTGLTRTAEHLDHLSLLAQKFLQINYPEVLADSTPAMTKQTPDRYSRKGEIIRMYCEHAGTIIVAKDDCTAQVFTMSGRMIGSFGLHASSPKLIPTRMNGVYLFHVRAKSGTFVQSYTTMPTH